MSGFEQTSRHKKFGVKAHGFVLAPFTSVEGMYPLTASGGCGPITALFRFIPLEVWETWRRRMRVSPLALKSVVFIGAETDRGFSPNGTGFLAVKLYENMVAPVIVTARHVIEQIGGNDFSIRVNRKDGSAETRRLSKDNVVHFADNAIDLAVFPVPIDHTIYDVHAILIDRAEWNRQVESVKIPPLQPGDEISITGLYTSHYGLDKNMPVVRTGHIAAVPTEPVYTDRGFSSGFIVEANSIAGLSGSPVFWNVPTVRVVNEQLQYLPDLIQIPLGIFIGYHVVRTREDEIIVPEFQNDGHDWVGAERPKDLPKEERRTGFGVVLPIHYIFQMFESEEMMKHIRAAAEEYKKSSGYRPASAGVTANDDDGDRDHRERFKFLLSAAARKRPQGGQTSHGENGENSGDS